MVRLVNRLALAGKAIDQIKRIENVLEVNKQSTSVGDFNLAMRESKDYAMMVADAADEAQSILEGIQAKVNHYLGKL